MNVGSLHKHVKEIVIKMLQQLRAKQTQWKIMGKNEKVLATIYSCTLVSALGCSSTIKTVIAKTYIDASFVYGVKENGGVDIITSQMRNLSLIEIISKVTQLTHDRPRMTLKTASCFFHKFHCPLKEALKKDIAETEVRAGWIDDTYLFL